MLCMPIKYSHADLSNYCFQFSAITKTIEIRWKLKLHSGFVAIFF